MSPLPSGKWQPVTNVARFSKMSKMSHSRVSQVRPAGAWLSLVAVYLLPGRVCTQPPEKGCKGTEAQNKKSKKRKKKN